MTGAAGALLVSLEDAPNPRRTWAVQTGVGGVTLALLWLLFAFVFPGQTVALRALAAGGLMGLGLFGAATAPIRLPDPCVWLGRGGGRGHSGAGLWVGVGLRRPLFRGSFGWGRSLAWVWPGACRP